MCYTLYMSGNVFFNTHFHLAWTISSQPKFDVIADLYGRVNLTHCKTIVSLRFLANRTAYSSIQKLIQALLLSILINHTQ